MMSHRKTNRTIFSILTVLAILLAGTSPIHAGIGDFELGTRDEHNYRENIPCPVGQKYEHYTMERGISPSSPNNKKRDAIRCVDGAETILRFTPKYPLLIIAIILMIAASATTIVLTSILFYRKKTSRGLQASVVQKDAKPQF